MMITIFDDKKSLFHFFLGFITPILHEWGLYLFVVFLAYQLWEKEKLTNKIGDFIEFMTGAGGWALFYTISQAI